LLSMANYSNNRFVTFKQALDAGGNVRKGEKGWPVIYVEYLEVEDRHSGELKEVPFCKHYTVFNVSQCDNLPAKFTEELPHADNPVIPSCAEVVERMPNKPAIVHGFAQAAYCRGTDQVEMPSINLFTNSEAYFEVLFHELAHSTGHASRVGRFQPGTMNRFGSKEYGKEELIAEITAAALCHETGIFDKVERNTTAYLQGWIKRIREDKNALVSAARQAEKATDYILGSSKE
jgi:antirestriction protein ArdC